MNQKTINESTILWEPSLEFKESTNIFRYMNWLKENRNLSFDDYHALWHWSITEIEDFWGSIWEFFEIKSSFWFKPMSSPLNLSTSFKMCTPAQIRKSCHSIVP